MLRIRFLCVQMFISHLFHISTCFQTLSIVIEKTGHQTHSPKPNCCLEVGQIYLSICLASVMFSKFCMFETWTIFMKPRGQKGFLFGTQKWWLKDVKRIHVWKKTKGGFKNPANLPNLGLLAKQLHLPCLRNLPWQADGKQWSGWVRRVGRGSFHVLGMMFSRTSMTQAGKGQGCFFSVAIDLGNNRSLQLMVKES